MIPLIAQYLLIILTVIACLTIKSASIRPILFVAALVLFLHILITPYPDDNPRTKSQVGVVGSLILGTALDLLILRPNSLDTIKPIKQGKLTSHLGIISRLKWAVSLLLNVRGSNWTCAIRGLRYPQYTSKRQYVLTQLLWGGFYYLAVDVLAIFTRRNPAFQYPPTETLSAHGLGWQFFNVAVFWLTMITSMNRDHMLFAAVTVALGIWDPEDWAVFFGEWSKTQSVRTFWGRSWHQSMRRGIQPQAKYLTSNILHLPPHSLLSKYIELFTCFLLSGLYHSAGDWLVLRNPITVLANLEFFLLQAVIIALEDILIFLGAKAGIRRIPSVLSYVWVIGWMTLTSPMWIETVALGDNIRFAPEVSVVELLRSRLPHMRF